MFCSPQGCYHFKRLPYGIYSASEVFQQDVTSIASDALGSVTSQDNIIVWGRNFVEHNGLLNKVLLINEVL